MKHPQRWLAFNTHQPIPFRHVINLVTFPSQQAKGNEIKMLGNLESKIPGFQIPPLLFFHSDKLKCRLLVCKTKIYTKPDISGNSLTQLPIFRPIQNKNGRLSSSTWLRNRRYTPRTCRLPRRLSRPLRLRNLSLSLFDFSFASLFLVVELCVCLCFCFCCFLKQSKIVHLCFALNANSQRHFCRLSFCLVTQKM